MTNSERHARLLLEYYNHSMMNRALKRIFKNITSEAERKLADKVLELIPTLFTSRMHDRIITYMTSLLDEVILHDQVLRGKLKDKIKGYIDKYISESIEQLVKNRLTNLTAEAIRAQLRRGY